ncbi:MAG: PIN domain-containing protein [Legionellales bacterium]|nr:PIN domain-containing protein [Legionellales bacterium]
MEVIRLFLDACIIIYWVESAEPFYSKLLSQLQDIAEKNPHHVLTISRLSFLECLVKPIREKDKKTLRIYKDFFEANHLEIIEIDQKVIELATDLRARHNLRTPDAIQAASCMIGGGDHLFLTGDKHFGSVSKLSTCIL